nr:unnamed protein product [Callosobruchus chinensis]
MAKYHGTFIICNLKKSHA